MALTCSTPALALRHGSGKQANRQWIARGNAALADLISKLASTGWIAGGTTP